MYNFAILQPGKVYKYTERKIIPKFVGLTDTENYIYDADKDYIHTCMQWIYINTNKHIYNMYNINICCCPLCMDGVYKIAYFIYPVDNIFIYIKY